MKKIKKIILVLLRCCLSSDYRFLRRMKAFDPGYYLESKGWAEDSDPDPLWGYVKTDWSAVGGDPHPLFDTAYYRSRYKAENENQNPFVFYLRHGWKLGHQPGPYFDTDLYQGQSGWAPEDGNPLLHYIRHGHKLGLSPSHCFDYEYYLDKNPVVNVARHEIIKHYKLHGARLNKSPLPLFDPVYYRSQHGEDIVDPLAHYLTWAGSSGAWPNAFFDPDFYVANCGEQVEKEGAFLHYLSHGILEGFPCSARARAIAGGPRISILVPVYNPKPSVLRNCIRSLLYQAYPNWELCLVDDCSPKDDVRTLLELWAGQDSRIKLRCLDTNSGIAAATNAAAVLATGDYLGFLDNDDELTVDCLLEVTEAIVGEAADLVYSDEDLIGDDGSTLSVFRKPPLNRELLLSHNYITHFVCVEKSLFDRVGGLGSQFDGAQDYDLMLKLVEVSRKVVHLPKVLYHWRASESSTSINHDQKNYANAAGRAALAAAMERRNLPLTAEYSELNFYYRLAAADKETAMREAMVSVLVWSEKDADRMQTPAEIRELAGYENVEFLLAGDVVTVGAFGEDGCEVSIIETGEHETRTSTLLGAAREASGEYLVFLDGTGSLGRGWLIELLLPFSFPCVGLVCGRVSYAGADGPSYIVPDLGNSSARYLQGFLQLSSRHMAGLHCLQEVGFAGTELTLVRREDYLNFHSTEKSRDDSGLFAMLDYSMYLRAAGKRLVYTPFASIDKGAEQAARLDKDLPGQQEEKGVFQKRLRKGGCLHDPLYNPSLLKDYNIDPDQYRQWLWGGDRE